MGGGGWDKDKYRDREKERQDAGISAFHYDNLMRHTPTHGRKVHESLDPNGVIREACDSEALPMSLAIAVLFDVSGSMGTVPRRLRQQLANLMDMLQNSDVRNAQVMFGAIGDHEYDVAPLQVGQFESDAMMAHWLDLIFIEEGGGGNERESYALAFYFMLKHTEIDCFKKRGHKGHLFIIADELVRPTLSRAAIRDILGDDVKEDIPTEKIIEDLKNKYEVYILFPKNGSGYSDNSYHHDHWKSLFPERFFFFSDPAEVSGLIASIVSKREGSFTDDQILDELKRQGYSKETRDSIKSNILDGITSVTGDLPGLE